MLKNHKVQLRDPVGSIEGPRLVLEPIEVRSCVPRVLWNVFCCSELQNITDTADFRVDNDSDLFKTKNTFLAEILTELKQFENKENLFKL